jgi:hypothetical protein
MLSAIRCLLACVTVLTFAAAGVAGPPVSYTEVAREFVSNVGFLNPGVPVALSDDGRVVFSAESLPSELDGLFAWQAGVLTPIDLSGGNYTVLTSIAVNSAGHVAFVSRRDPAGADLFQGVYRTTTAATPILTLHEDLQGPDPGPAARFAALSENGTVAYSTIDDGNGAIFRGPITGAPSILRSGSGIFFNTQRLDVNDAGQVAVQMEHVRPFGGLGRGILVFENSEQPLTSNKTAIEQTGVGVQPMPSINSAGQVAFSLNTTVTMNFYDPANNSGGTLIDSVTLDPGVYVTEPAGYGLPRSYTTIVDNTGPFESFGRVVINDAGMVVFQAGLDGGGGGLYIGDDPVADKIIELGEFIDETQVSFIALGELNNNGQFTFITSDFISTDRQVWLATIPEPGAAALLGIAAACLIGRRPARRRSA